MLKRNLTFLLMAGLALGMLASVTSSNLATAAQQSSIEVAVLWSGDELTAFQDVVAAFEKQNPNITVTVNSVGRDLPTVIVTRCQAGNPPDVAALPNPGQMRELVEKGCGSTVPGLAALDPAIVADNPKAFVDLGSVNGKIYGIFLSADVKGLIWYNTHELGPNFDLSSSWDSLLAFTAAAGVSGKTAWCVGLESGAASGWPGTDWIEDFMLRTAGPAVYDQWVNHDIPWTDARVKHAWELFGEIALNPKYVLGGPQGALATNFGDSPNGLFTSPPGCYFHHQATFIQSFIQQANPSLQPVKDFNFFGFPTIDPTVGNVLEGAGDLISMFKDSPAAEAFMKYLASGDAQTLWAQKLQKLPVNSKADLSVLNPLAARAAELLRTASAFRFDGSDLMPAAVGSGAFWKGVLDYVNGADLCTVLKTIEQAADQAYTSGAATNNVVEKGAC